MGIKVLTTAKRIAFTFAFAAAIVPAAQASVGSQASGQRCKKCDRAHLCSPAHRRRRRRRQPRTRRHASPSPPQAQPARRAHRTRTRGDCADGRRAHRPRDRGAALDHTSDGRNTRPATSSKSSPSQAAPRTTAGSTQSSPTSAPSRFTRGYGTRELAQSRACARTARTSGRETTCAGRPSNR